MKPSTVVFVLCAVGLSGCSGAPSPERAPAAQSTPPPAAPPQPAAQTSAAAAPAAGAGVGEIKALVFQDINRNGVLDPGDTGVAGTPAAVLTADATKDVVSALTGADGSSIFAKLPAGPYRLRFQIPAGYERTSDDSFVVTVLPDHTVEARFGVARKQ